MTSDLRIGIDLGGTKIAAAALDKGGEMRLSLRAPTPRNDYSATLDAIASLVLEIEGETGRKGTVGIGMPGSISPGTGLVQNANSVWLNGRPLHNDLEARLGRPVRFANDANCFALSEATDGAARDAQTVFGVILGTGCGGGLVVAGKVLTGPHAVCGEWGHNPLPWSTDAEHPGPECWCGRRGCMETWVSGPGLAADHARVTGQETTADEIARDARNGNAEAQATLDRHCDRLARGLASVVNLIDPDVIVLGGGLSELKHLYDRLPEQIAAHVFADHCRIEVRPPAFGATSGVRGAAWLWNDP